MSVPMAEITRARADLRCAVLELGAKKIWFEGDSSSVVRWINTNKGNGGYSDEWVHGMGVWADLTEEFLYSHFA